MTLARASLVASVLLVACGDERSPGDAASVLPDNRAVELPRAGDKDAGAASFGFDLRAAPATKTFGDAPKTPVWAYNGAVPGPLVEAAVGDDFSAHFENALPEETTIHWHGVRVPNAMDGVPMLGTVAPGASFDFAFRFQDAGLFWFHPHVHADIQVQRGLVGTIVVRGPGEPVVDRELVMVLDDLRLAKDGTIDEYPDDEGVMLGREGKTLLVNGVVTPTLEARPGETLRLRLVNSANGRFFNLALEKHGFHVIGTDGGLVAHPYEADRVLLGPGDRVDLLVEVRGASGDTFELTTEPYERGHDTGMNPAMKVATLRLVGDAVVGKPVPTAGPKLELLPDGPSAFSIVLNEGLRDGEQVFTINGAVAPDVPPIMVPLGATRVFEVKNDAEMDHPFHLHGFFFQVLARGGKVVPPSERTNEDTLIVPAKSSVTLVARFDAPGMWMYHCHILEHSERGMMGTIMVE